MEAQTDATDPTAGGIDAGGAPPGIGVGGQNRSRRLPPFVSSLEPRVLLTEVSVVLLLTWLPVVVGFLGTQEHGGSTPGDWASGLCTTLGIGSLVVYLMWRDTRWRQNLGLSDLRWIREVLWGAAILVGLFISFAVIRAVCTSLGAWPDPADPSPASEAKTQLAPVMLALGVGAIVEELLFRGYLLARLIVLLRSRVLALVLSSTVFAAGHGYPVGPSVHLFVQGMILGGCFVVSQRLPRLVMAHFAWNLWPYVVL